MAYCSVKDMSQKWGLSARRVQQLCSGGQIAGAVRFGRSWQIPNDAKKPAAFDLPENSLPPLFPTVHATSYYPVCTPLEALVEQLPPQHRVQYLAEVAYYRGEYETSFALLEAAPEDGEMRLARLLTMCNAAASMGNAALYRAAASKIDALHEACRGSAQMQKLVELAQAELAASIYTMEQCPEWLKREELSGLPRAAKYNAFYVYAKYLDSCGEHEKIVAICETLLQLGEGTESLGTLYLQIACARAAVSLGWMEKADRYIGAAIALGWPQGAYAPFAENLAALRGIVKKHVTPELQEEYKAVEALWAKVFPHWAEIHGMTAKDVPTLLSLREHQTAALAKDGYTNAQIAGILGVSAGSVKGYLQTVYEKLHINRRADLAKFIF